MVGIYGVLQHSLAEYGRRPSRYPANCRGHDSDRSFELRRVFLRPLSERQRTARDWRRRWHDAELLLLSA
jgi:hypothetical protein